MQHRRDTDGLTHLGQTRPAVYCRSSGRQQPLHGAGNAVAAGGQHDNVIFNQLFDQRQMRLVVPRAGIVTADHAGNSADAAVDDIVIEGVIRTAEGAPQMILN